MQSPPRGRGHGAGSTELRRQAGPFLITGTFWDIVRHLSLRPCPCLGAGYPKPAATAQLIGPRDPTPPGEAWTWPNDLGHEGRCMIGIVSALVCVATLGPVNEKMSSRGRPPKRHSRPQARPAPQPSARPPIGFCRGQSVGATLVVALASPVTTPTDIPTSLVFTRPPPAPSPPHGPRD